MVNLRNKQSCQSQLQPHPQHIQRLRWMFVIALMVWTILAVTMPVLVFLLTKTLLSLTGLAGLGPSFYLWHRYANFVFPMDDKMFELEKMRLQVRIKNKFKK